MAVLASEVDKLPLKDEVRFLEVALEEARTHVIPPKQAVIDAILRQEHANATEGLKKILAQWSSEIDQGEEARRVINRALHGTDEAYKSDVDVLDDNNTVSRSEGAGGYWSRIYDATEKRCLKCGEYEAIQHQDQQGQMGMLSRIKSDKKFRAIMYSAILIMALGIAIKLFPKEAPNLLILIFAYFYQFKWSVLITAAVVFFIFWRKLKKQNSIVRSIQFLKAQ